MIGDGGDGGAGRTNATQRDNLAPVASSLRLTLDLTALLLRKDLRILSRSRETLALVLLFTVLCVLIFAFGFLREGGLGDDVVPGVLWVTLQFSGTIALLRLFAAEEEAGTLPMVLRTVAGTGPIFFSKALLQLAFSTLVTALLLPMVIVFFDVGRFDVGVVMVALALGLIGQAVVGTLVAALMIRVRLREVMLPLVLYPLLAPVLIAGVKVTALALSGGDRAIIGTWLSLMVVFDLVFVIASPWLHARAVQA